METTMVYYGQTKSLWRYSEDYVPAMDGWRRLRDGSMPEQDLFVFDVPTELLADLAKEKVAEALFVATNAPLEVIAPGTLSRWFADALIDRTYRAVGEDCTRALSVGDTVTVEGQPSVACEKQGWKEIA